MLSTAGTYAASNKTRYRSNTCETQPKGEFKSKKLTKSKSGSRDIKDSSSNSELPNNFFTLDSFESCEMKRAQGNKFYRSSRRRSSDSIDINRNLPEYIANLRPGEIDCPCLLHCQRRSREFHPSSSLPIKEQTAVCPKVTANRLSLDSRLINTNVKLNPFTSEMSDIKETGRRRNTNDIQESVVKDIVHNDNRSFSTTTPTTSKRKHKYRNVAVQTEIYQPPTTIFCCIIPRWKTTKRKQQIQNIDLNTL